MSLLKDFGSSYFSKRFAGSFFRGPEGQTCIFRSYNANSGLVIAEAVGGTINKPSSTDIEISNTFFDTMKVFATPELGWRVAAAGKYLVHLTQDNTSYHRGLNYNRVQRELSQLTRELEHAGAVSTDYYSREATTAKLVMEPVFLPMMEGLDLLSKGKIVSFAISNELAVFPETEDMMALMFKTKKVGTVDLNGNIECNIPFIRKLGA